MIRLLLRVIYGADDNSRKSGNEQFYRSSDATENSGCSRSSRRSIQGIQLVLESEDGNCGDASVCSVHALETDGAMQLQEDGEKDKRNNNNAPQSRVSSICLAIGQVIPRERTYQVLQVHGSTNSFEKPRSFFCSCCKIIFYISLSFFLFIIISMLSIRHGDSRPSLLSIVHHQTHQFISPIENELYQHLKTATFHDDPVAKRSIDSEETAYIAQTRKADTTEINVNKKQISFRESITITWAGTNIQDDDIIALYCYSKSPSKQHYQQEIEPAQFLDVATIAQAKATSLYHSKYAHIAKRDIFNPSPSPIVDRNEANKNYDNQWKIQSFPIIREEACEFRLWKRYTPKSQSVFRKLSSSASLLSASFPSFSLRNEVNHYYKYGATTGIFHIRDSKTTPTALHMSLTNDPTEMILSFTTGIKGLPIVQYFEYHTNHKIDIHSSSFDNNDYNRQWHRNKTIHKSSDSEDGRYVTEQYSANTSATQLNQHQKQATVAIGSSTTYHSADMCQEPATSTDPGRFINPGMLHTVKLTNLKMNTIYRYRVATIPHDLDANDHESLLSLVQGANFTYVNSTTGDRRSVSNKIVWSEMHSFQSAPKVGPNNDESFRYITYADQGSPVDGSWDVGKSRIVNMVMRDILGKSIKGLTATRRNVNAIDVATDEEVASSLQKQPVRSIHHIGDLSYARGIGSLWDGWFDMISNFSVLVPLMISIGNHEYDHLDGGGLDKDPSGVASRAGYNPWWGNFRNDSGGECGLPTSKRFTMPPNGNGVFWYSYNYASVHTVVISSEHDLRPGSIQYEWLERDLASVDRTITPWLIVECHRPMYNTEYSSNIMSGITFEKSVGRHIRQEFEDLLYVYNVDLFLSGHYHSYLRLCDGLYRSKCDNGGPLHITIGTAGGKLDKTTVHDRNDWVEKFIIDYGYGIISIVNRTALLWEFIGFEHNATTKDSFWLLRQR